MSGRAYKDVSSAHDAVAIDVSSADQTLAAGSRGIHVGTAGNIKVTMVGGATVTFSNVPVGVFPIQASKVFNSGTTASGMIALY